MAGHGGGAWKVAYADFVTAMMAFFMVMWLTAQKPEVKEAVAGYFRDPYSIFQGIEAGHAADAAPLDDPKLGHNSQSQKRRLPRPGDEVDYQFTVVFADGAAELDPAGREMIRTFAPTLVGKLNRVEVRAHCQSKPLPPDSAFKDRWDLCYARARAVQDELLNLGVEPNRIRVSLAEANEPLATNLTPEELQLNSRVDVILLPDLVETPWQKGNAHAHEGPLDEPEGALKIEHDAEHAESHGDAPAESHDEPLAAPHDEPHADAHAEH